MTWVVNMARLAGYQTDDFDTHACVDGVCNLQTTIFTPLTSVASLTAGSAPP